jgi:hypothetical protein
VDGLINTPDFGHRLSQLGGAVVDPKSPHDRSCLDQTEFQRAGESKQIIPVLFDEIRIDAMRATPFKAP